MKTGAVQLRLVDEAAVFLADELLIGTEPVSIERRLEDSANRSLTEETARGAL